MHKIVILLKSIFASYTLTTQKYINTCLYSCLHFSALSG